MAGKSSDWMKIMLSIREIAVYHLLNMIIITFIDTVGEIGVRVKCLEFEYQYHCIYNFTIL